ncbi:hypothetical protein [Catellatospora chokoriensis]|uniref:Uncharacterized protein n=1 Tax=Catellatospora chokoriensis TaxID=310353 RepID=A0A8J3NUJ1_9ACTN|nr:hypothetical protein [Catellatospora chokoriensis]GIF93070.1 hypothetical protein Cch02nite_65140 [Catellatospora chokoriensis]
MNDRLDDLVRQAQTLDPARAAALGDPQLRQRLLQEITTMDTSPQPAAPPARRTWRLVAVTAATLAAAAAAFVLIGLPGQGQSPPAAATSTPASATPAPQGDVFGGSASCVETYSPQALRQRAFAFDGTVLAIGQTDPTKVETSPEVPVTFQVHRWYRGGQGEQVTVAMMPPGAITSAGDAGYGIGSRLLVSGEPRFGGRPLDDPIAWSCGFTRWHTATDAQTWQQTFA